MITIATYVMSDIHGQYDLLMDIIEKIKLNDEDTLYVLGDLIDRGPHPIKTVLKLMEMPNVICLVGNHELMAIDCLDFLMKEITNESIASMDAMTINNIVSWKINGCDTTLKEFRALDRETQMEVLVFFKDFSLYEEVTVGDKDYFLVHAGLGNYRPDKKIEEYSVFEMVWDRADYDIQYFPDKYTVSGHTTTQFMEGNPKPGYIFKKNNHIAIDCGAHIPGGRLAALCLDTGEEFYSSYDD